MISSIVGLGIVTIDTRFEEYLMEHLIQHLMEESNISWKKLNEEKWWELLGSMDHQIVYFGNLCFVL